MARPQQPQLSYLHHQSIYPHTVRAVFLYCYLKIWGNKNTVSLANVGADGFALHSTKRVVITERIQNDNWHALLHS